MPLIGGAELAVGNITDRISDFEFDLITAKIRPGLSNFEKIGNINTYRVGWGINFDKLLLPFLGLIKALRLNNKNHYNVVWAIMASYGGFAGLFFKILKPRTKFLLTLQEGDDLAYIKKRVGIFNFLFEAIFKRADHIQAISKFLAEWAEDLGAKCPIEVVPNGVDLGIFKPVWTAENLNINIIVTVSRLVEKNGIKYLIEALQYTDGELWIIGDGALRIDLEKTAESSGVGDRVRFLGNLSAPEVAGKLAQASIFVRPSLSEGLGNAFLEAMAMGMPVIGTAVGGIPDFLRDGETGWICEVKNSKNIAEKINYIFDGKNRAEIERVVEAAKRMIEEKYDWKNISESMKAIFYKLT
ncbi:MAG: glycosyltransferase family 4 protein [Candidatus Buchananbacteria bacterium]